VPGLIRRILVPVDFSESSERAIQYAGQLAADRDARVELVHVLDDPYLAGAWPTESYLPSAAVVLDGLADAAAIRLAKRAALLTSEHVPSRSVVLRGNPARKIIEYAASFGFDVIVMGRHGRSALAHLLMGGVAERVLRTARCPVLIINRTTHDAGRHEAMQDGASPPEGCVDASATTAWS
jgi:universal stress protein A